MKSNDPNKITTISIRNRTRWKLEKLREKIGMRTSFDALIAAMIEQVSGEGKKEK